MLRLLVGFNRNSDQKQCKALHQTIGCQFVKQFAPIHVDVVEVDQENLAKALQDYRASSLVSYVEMDKIYSVDFTPNDPFYLTPTQTSNNGLQSQWGLRRTNPEGAWDQAVNLTSTQIIAILDTGIDPNHPDLASKIFMPRNFTTSDPNDYIDRGNHGTHVAGIAAAVTNNLTGIAGMSFNTARIMPLKVLGDNGDGLNSWIIEAILFAVNNGARVINMSLGGAPYDQAFQDAITFAWERGCVIVASTGNRGHEQIQYPAGYNFVLAVSATNEQNNRASFANWGSHVGITAPGTAILSTTPTYPAPDSLQNYDTFNGTSQSTPFVSGLAAMLFAIYPNLTNQGVVQLMQRGANMINSDTKEWTSFFGYGLLDATNAVNQTFGSRIPILSATTGDTEVGELAMNSANTAQGLSTTSEFNTTNLMESEAIATETTENTSGKKKKKSSKKKKPSKKKKRPPERTRFGCFYGQVVNQEGLPIAGARVIARTEQGKIVAQYFTKTNILIGEGISHPDEVSNGQSNLLRPPVEDCFGSDGMFRLINLPPGNYNIYVQLPSQVPGCEEPLIHVKKATIVPGADVYLRLVV